MLTRCTAPETVKELIHLDWRVGLADQIIKNVLKIKALFALDVESRYFTVFWASTYQIKGIKIKKIYYPHLMRIEPKLILT